MLFAMYSLLRTVCDVHCILYVVHYAQSSVHTYVYTYFAQSTCSQTNIHIYVPTCSRTYNAYWSTCSVSIAHRLTISVEHTIEVHGHAHKYIHVHMYIFFFRRTFLRTYKITYVCFTDIHTCSQTYILRRTCLHT